VFVKDITDSPFTTEMHMQGCDQGWSSCSPNYSTQHTYH